MFKQRCEESETRLRECFGKPYDVTAKFLELKPIQNSGSSDNVIISAPQPTENELLTTSTDINPLNSVSEVIDSVVNSSVNENDETTLLISIINPNMKLEECTAEGEMILGGGNCDFIHVSDDEIDKKNTKVENRLKNNKTRETVNNKDDTDQPIYPCEECTQCFVTLIDLKVCIHLNNVKN